MPYRVAILPVALRQLQALDAPARARVRSRIDDLAHNPRPQGTKALQGDPGTLRLRVGDYRVLYRVEDDLLVVLVVTVGHRREVYRRRR
jgi:mRNA interferase RelE/StbE